MFVVCVYCLLEQMSCKLNVSELLVIAGRSLFVPDDFPLVDHQALVLIFLRMLQRCGAALHPRGRAAAATAASNVGEGGTSGHLSQNGYGLQTMALAGEIDPFLDIGG